MQKAPTKLNPSLMLDIIPQILSYCDAQTLSRASSTCKSWYELASDNDLWNELCKHNFGVIASELNPEPDPTRILYVMSYRKMKAVWRGSLEGMNDVGVRSINGNVLRSVLQSVQM
jgi:hypothetical protein